ncbi:hypothetical protein XI08_11135 [Bradyrhizobium sp. CCBAU 11361]|nr:hypothetical protein [Bradyrhizobium sp. CCBAU 11361]
MATDSDRTDTGHHLAFRQETVADDALMTVRGLQIGMLAEKVLSLGLDRLGETSTCPATQHFYELIGDVCNQLEDVSFGHGLSLLHPNASRGTAWRANLSERLHGGSLLCS